MKHTKHPPPPGLPRVSLDGRSELLQTRHVVVVIVTDADEHGEPIPMTSSLVSGENVKLQDKHTYIFRYFLCPHNFVASFYMIGGCTSGADDSLVDEAVQPALP